MPFIAKVKATDERICALHEKKLKAKYRKGDLVCPFCAKLMIPKQGLILRPHFAHESSCDSDYEHKPESPEHLAGKAAVAELLEHEYSKQGLEVIVDYEVPFPQVHRIADVCVKHSGGWVEVHEIQLAAITVEHLEERTRDYEQCEAEVHWWFGSNARTNTTIRWSEGRFGAAHIINYHSESRSSTRPQF